MIIQGLILMVVGMGVVFVFLTLMVLCMQGTSVLIQKYAPYVPETETQNTPTNNFTDIAIAVAAVRHKMK